jgi:hypothetical protein
MSTSPKSSSLPKVITTNITVKKNGYATVGNIGAETAGGDSVTVRGVGGRGQNFGTLPYSQCIFRHVYVCVCVCVCVRTCMYVSIQSHVRCNTCFLESLKLPQDSLFVEQCYKSLRPILKAKSFLALVSVMVLYQLHATHSFLVTNDLEGFLQRPTERRQRIQQVEFHQINSYIQCAYCAI